MENFSKLKIINKNKFDNEKTYQDTYYSLSVFRKKKIDKMKFKDGKLLSLSAGYLINKLCLENNIIEKEINYQFNKYEKPFIKELTEKSIYFNISHSKDYAILTSNNRNIGCDIEFIKDIDLNIAKNFFSDIENEYINTASSFEEKLGKFYKIWTLKESYIKCIGEGLNIPLNSFSIKINEDNTVVPIQNKNKSYYFKMINKLENYQISVCSEEIEYEPQILIH